MADATEIANWYDNNPVVQAMVQVAYERGVAEGEKRGRTAAAAAADARWDDGHRAGWIEGRADGLDAGRSEAAAAIRAKAANYVGEQFRHFEMCARIADGQRVPNTRQDAAAARIAENVRDGDGWLCGAFSRSIFDLAPYRCTEPNGHDGDHRAVVDGEVAAEWPQENGADDGR